MSFSSRFNGALAAVAMVAFIPPAYAEETTQPSLTYGALVSEETLSRYAGMPVFKVVGPLWWESEDEERATMPQTEHTDTAELNAILMEADPALASFSIVSGDGEGSLAQRMTHAAYGQWVLRGRGGQNFCVIGVADEEIGELWDTLDKIIAAYECSHADETMTFENGRQVNPLAFSNALAALHRAGHSVSEAAAMQYIFRQNPDGQNQAEIFPNLPFFVPYFLDIASLPHTPQNYTTLYSKMGAFFSSGVSMGRFVDQLVHNIQGTPGFESALSYALLKYSISKNWTGGLPTLSQSLTSFITSSERRASLTSANLR